ncbi:MAG: hypothetical protein GY917_08220, partial [Planctomycetaceae bacterium]|nr:hypothetical protein [Planctomycetaceae bacterium]
RGRFEIVTLELSIGERPLADCVQAASELIGPNGRVIPLGNAQKLLITETAGKLLAINLAVSAVPVPKTPPKPTPEPKPVLTVYPIKGLDPSATVETLQALFSAGTIRADTGAEEIHAYAPPETQSGIKSSVEKMLAAISNERKPQLQIYPVETKNSEQLLAQLLVAAPKAQVTFDEPQSRLLVVANAEQQQLVQDTVKKLGAESAKPDTENSVSIYRVELKNTDNLTTLLQAVIPRALVISQPGRIAVRGRLEEQKIAKATIDQFQNSDEPVDTPLLKLYSLKRALDTELVESIRSTVPEATLTRLSEGKRLYALASARDQALIAATLKQLEQDLPPEDTKKLLVYPLDEIAFDQAQPLLTTIIPDLQIRSDASGKRMLIWAMAREHEIIQATLEQLQKGLPLADAKKLTVYPLAKMALDQVEPLLATIVPNAEIRSDSTGKRLLIWALAKEHAVIDATLKQLEQDLPLPDAKTLTVYPLGEMAFDQAQTLLTAIVPDAEIRSDTAGKRLLIWALKQEHEKIANTLKQVNSLPLEKRSLTTYDLPMDRANEVLATVVSLLPDAQVSLDSTQRRLLVIGYPQEQELASSLVKKLAAGAGQPARVLIAYPLKKADPAAVLEMLQELQPDARFAADTRAKRILVTASLPLQARLQAIIEQLDAAPDTQLETVAQTYHIKHVTAEPLIELLESLYPDMKFVAEPSNRKLIVTGTNYDHQKLSLTLERIDAGGPAGRQVKTYPAGQSDPNQLANVIIQLVPTAVISTNTETKRLIIWADEDGHRAIGQAVQQFTQQDAAKARTLKTHPLPQAAKGVTLRGVTGLQAILELMQEALPAANISLDETNQRVIAWASEEDHQTILKMIKEFSKDPPANRGVHLKTHQAAPDVLRNAEPLLADVAPNARRVETTDTDKWLVWASEEEQKAIDKLLVDLEKQLSLARPRRLLKTYAVTKADISMAQQLISETAPGATILEGTAPQQILVQATEQDHGRIDAILKSLATVLQKPETSLHVYAINPQQSSLIQDLITKRTADATLLENVTPGQLVIQAPEGDHDIIAKLLEELSQKLAPPAKRIQVYPIPKDQATVARELIQQVAPQATILESPYDNKLVVTALPDSHLNIATALKEISGMLKKPGTSVRVYPIDKDRLLAQTVLDHFDAAITADASIQLNEVTNALIVRASTEQHSQIKQAVAALLEQLPMPAKPTTQVYTLKLASAEAVQEALSPLVTSGSVVADPSSDSILVTANAEEQKRVADVVKQLDQVPNRTATVKAYRIKQADPEAIFTSLSKTFNKNKQFIIQFQPATSSVHLIATAKNHVIFQELMKELDQPDTEGTVVQVFPFDEARITAEQVVASLDESLTQSLSLQVNEKVNSLIARGGEASQKKLQIAIDAIVKQLPMPAKPTTQVYTLKLASAEAV